MTTIAITLVVTFLLAVGFAAGFLTRELISRRKRRLLEKQHEGWK
jgi:hypothetical protein